MNGQAAAMTYLSQTVHSMPKKGRIEQNNTEACRLSYYNIQ